MKGRNIVLVAIVVVAILSFLYVVRRSRETFDPKTTVMSGPRLLKDRDILRTIKTPTGYIFATEDGPYVRISATDEDGTVITNRYYYGTIETLDSHIGPPPYDGLHGLMVAHNTEYRVVTNNSNPLPIPDLLPLPSDKSIPPPVHPKPTKEEIESKKIVLTHNCVDCLYDEDGKMRCNCKFKQRKTASAGPTDNTSVLFLDSK